MTRTVLLSLSLVLAGTNCSHPTDPSVNPPPAIFIANEQEYAFGTVHSSEASIHVTLTVAGKPIRELHLIGDLERELATLNGRDLWVWGTITGLGSELNVSGYSLDPNFVRPFIR